jgi:hypothetical protein
VEVEAVVVVVASTVVVVVVASTAVVVVVASTVVEVSVVDSMAAASAGSTGAALADRVADSVSRRLAARALPLARGQALAGRSW